MAQHAEDKSPRKPGGTNGQSLLKVIDLVKCYNLGEVEVKALRGVSLSIEKGEFVAVMGPSGSGKSTFMNILGCLDTPSSGTYMLDGVDVSAMTSDELAVIRNLKLGFVFQGFNLLSRTSAIENVELPMFYSSRIDPDERHPRALAALESVGLKERFHHMPSQLSGGEQQRVAIARALVNEPALILADEPTGNLDTKTSFEIMRIFQNLNVDKGITIIMVTHEADIARFSQRIIELRDGRLKKDKPVTDRLIADELIKNNVFTFDGQVLDQNGQNGGR